MGSISVEKTQKPLQITANYLTVIAEIQVFFHVCTQQKQMEICQTRSYVKLLSVVTLSTSEQ